MILSTVSQGSPDINPGGIRSENGNVLFNMATFQNEPLAGRALKGIGEVPKIKQCHTTTTHVTSHPRNQAHLVYVKIVIKRGRRSL